jgi:gliding motility-associated lipoprotein GldH
MGKMANKFASLLIFLCVALFSCSENRVFEEFHPLPNMQWAENDSVVFDLSKLNSVEGKSLIALRYTEYYPHSNCYIRLVSLDSTGRTLQSKLLNVPIFNSKTGQPMGKGFGSTYTKYDTIPFSLPVETKLLVVKQYMRKEQLEGIEAVGLKILRE